MEDSSIEDSSSQQGCLSMVLYLLLRDVIMLDMRNTFAARKPCILLHYGQPPSPGTVNQSGCCLLGYIPLMILFWILYICFLPLSFHLLPCACAAPSAFSQLPFPATATLLSSQPVSFPGNL